MLHQTAERWTEILCLYVINLMVSLIIIRDKFVPGPIIEEAMILSSSVFIDESH